MITYKNQLEQNSDEWHELRNNYITGTDAYDLLRGVSVKEILSKKRNNHFMGNYYTERGHRLEPEAKEIYSALYTPTKDVGFVINDKYKLAGVSPDGVVGEDGLVEVKAFNEKRHFSVYQNLDSHIIAQTQYQLFVTERKWCDLVLYNPDIEDPHQAFLVKRLYPNEKIQARFKEIFSAIDNSTNPA